MSEQTARKTITLKLSKLLLGIYDKIITNLKEI